MPSPRPRRSSAVEDEPAQLVSQALVIKHELTNRDREPVALPSALGAGARLGFGAWDSSPGGPDRVGRGTQLMSRHVRDRGGLPCRIGGMPGCALQVTRGGVGMAGGSSGLGHPDFSPRPRACQRDRATRALVSGPRRLEQVEHVLGTVGRPQSQQVMVIIAEAATTAHGDEARVPDLREDHRSVGAPGVDLGQPVDPEGLRQLSAVVRLVGEQAQQDRGAGVHLDRTGV
jgi:hypothetical protein